MSYEDLVGVINGDLSVSVEESDRWGRLWPVARGRLIGGDPRLNTLVIDTGATRPVVVTLTSRHRVAYTPDSQKQDDALLADAA